MPKGPEKPYQPAPKEIEKAENMMKDKEVKYSRKRELKLVSEQLESITGDNSKEAWNLRKRVLSLADANRDQKYRPESSYERVANSSELIIAVAKSLTGLDSEQAWDMREDISKLVFDKDRIIESTTGLDSDKAMAIRWRFLATHKAYKEVTKSLVGLNSKAAKEIRDYCDRLKRELDRNNRNSGSWRDSGDRDSLTPDADSKE